MCYPNEYPKTCSNHTQVMPKNCPKLVGAKRRGHRRPRFLTQRGSKMIANGIKLTSHLLSQSLLFGLLLRSSDETIYKVSSWQFWTKFVPPLRHGRTRTRVCCWNGQPNEPCTATYRQKTKSVSNISSLLCNRIINAPHWLSGSTLDLI